MTAVSLRTGVAHTHRESRNGPIANQSSPSSGGGHSRGNFTSTGSTSPTASALLTMSSLPSAP